MMLRAAKRLRSSGGSGRAMMDFARRTLGSSSSSLAQHPQPTQLSKLKDSFLDGTSGSYLETIEERYRADPSSVDKSWASFFKSLGA